MQQLLCRQNINQSYSTSYSSVTLLEYVICSLVKGSVLCKSRIYKVGVGRADGRGGELVALFCIECEEKSTNFLRRLLEKE